MSMEGPRFKKGEFSEEGEGKDSASSDGGTEGGQDRGRGVSQ